MSNQNSLAKTFDIFNKIRLQSPTLEKIWKEGFGDDYATEARPDAFYPQSVLDHISNTVGSSLEGRTMLDVGCGHGLTGVYLARRLRMRLFGIDLSPASIELATHNAEDLASNVDAALRPKFWVSDAASTGLATGACSLVTTLDVMLYFPDKLAAIKEFARVLEPNGILAFTSWEQEGFNERLGAAQVKDFRPLVVEAGFEVKTYEAVEGSDASHERVFRGLMEHESVLKGEIGDEATTMLLNMAKSAEKERSERRYVLCIAKRLNKTSTQS